MHIYIKYVTTDDTTYTLEPDGFTLLTLFHHLEDKFKINMNWGYLTCNSRSSKHNIYDINFSKDLLKLPLNQLITNESTLYWSYTFNKKLLLAKGEFITDNIISSLGHCNNGLFTAEIKTEVKLTNFMFELHLVDYYNPDDYLLIKDVTYVLYKDDTDKNSLKINIKFDSNSNNKYMLTIKYDNSDNELKNVECDGCKTCCKSKYQDIPQKVIILDQIHFKLKK